jgi:hypothetical protein
VYGCDCPNISFRSNVYTYLIVAVLHMGFRVTDIEMRLNTE